MRDETPRTKDAQGETGARGTRGGGAARPTRPREEVARLGKEIYERDIRSKAEARHLGEYVAIDVESGDWAVANSDGEALERLRALRPCAVDVLMERVGYRALHSFGAGSLRRTG